MRAPIRSSYGNEPLLPQTIITRIPEKCKTFGIGAKTVWSRTGGHGKAAAEVLLVSPKILWKIIKIILS
jgi:hypothetical protein